MKSSSYPAVTACLAALLVACSGSYTPVVQPSSSSAPRTEAESRAAAIARARADSARLPYTKADIDFMTGMIHHHAQAIEMANLVAERTASPEIKVLSGRIISAQEDEIGIMTRWLEDRLQPLPDWRAEAAGHGEHAGHGDHGTMMPGMLTPEEMAALKAARGREFDELFLRGMIKHHEGATEMVRQLFDTPGAGQDEMIFRFATDVNVDQRTEINRMHRMLFDVLMDR